MSKLLAIRICKRPFYKPTMQLAQQYDGQDILLLEDRSRDQHNRGCCSGLGLNLTDCGQEKRPINEFTQPKNL